MNKKFEYGNLRPFLVGFLNGVYDTVLMKIRQRQKQPGGGQVDAKFVQTVFTKELSAAYASVDGQTMLKLLEGEYSYQKKEVDKCHEAMLVSLINSIVQSDVIVPDHTKVTANLPLCSGPKWSLLQEYLYEIRQEHVVENIDRESSLVLQQILFAENPEPFKKFGLVLGQVQSGKTSNYSALIAKACDAGYRLFIILSGIHNDLRQQTQERLDEMFLGYHDYKYQDDGKTPQHRTEKCGVGLLSAYDESQAPESATYTDYDFNGEFKTHPNLNRSIIFVIKKNTTILDKLINYLGSPSNKKIYKDWPALIIDDEADQASINTNKDFSVTKTNKCIRELCAFFNKVTYIGYTATPFANVLIDSKIKHKKFGLDLFPRDFIVRLKAPENYFGPAQYFGDNRDDEGLDLFMPVSNSVSDLLVGSRKRKTKRSGGGPENLKKLPAECRKFFLQYLLSAAIRQWRHKKLHPDLWSDAIQDEDLDFDSLEEQPVLATSMLVHVSSRVSVHRHLAQLFVDLLDEIKGLLQGNATDRQIVFDDMRELFHAQRAVTESTMKIRKHSDLSQDWSLPAAFEELIPEITMAMEDMRLFVVNGDEQQSQEFAADDLGANGRKRAAHSVFIGGNKLSRGLTLPGLCLSLFLRESRMYDTLLQMGRWFGYRDGYVDLCRICTTTDIIDNFRAISEAMLDFEAQIDRMNENLRSPENFRLKILSHPGLRVTAQNKMKHADLKTISLNGTITECRDIGLEPKLLMENMSSAYSFYQGINQEGTLTYASPDFGLEPPERQASYFEKGKGSSGRVWKKVPARLVIDFLSKYKATQTGESTSLNPIIEYIREANKVNKLYYWNVFIPGEKGSGMFSLKYPKRHVNITDDHKTAFIRALKTGGHEYIGVAKDVIDKVTEIIGDQENLARGELFRTVRDQAGKMHPDTGYLILYLIEPSELPAQGDKPFIEAQELVGEPTPITTYYLWLPKTEPLKTSTAVSNDTVADLDDEDVEEIEFDEDQGE